MLYRRSTCIKVALLPVVLLAAKPALAKPMTSALLDNGNAMSSLQTSDAELQARSKNTTSLRISRSSYLHKLRGFWLGQNIANWTGLITEMDKVGTPQTLPFYTDDDWGSKDLPAMWGEGVPHSDRIDFYIEKVDGVWGADDDTDIEYMYLHLHHLHQTSKLTPAQIQQGWLAHTYADNEAPLFKKFVDSKPVRENFLWESNQTARDLMAKGVLPPQTSEESVNKKSMMIDAQLTTEIFGLLAPANVDVALDIARLPIRVAGNNEAAEIASFYVVMHSLASVVDTKQPMSQQTMWLANRAREYLTDGSYPAAMYDFVLQHYLENPDKSNWEATRDAIYQRYQLEQRDGYQQQDPFAAGINFAASLVSWFYGQGDFKRTIQIGTLTGWDSDNPTATWGGLLGFMLSVDGVKAAFAEDNMSERYWIHRTRRNFVDYTKDEDGDDNFALMSQRMLDVIDRVVKEQMQGHVDESSWQITWSKNQP
ncbi:ADP-ribosylglycohydrolase family protein [Thalassotalea ponticola]|uniref:ADP-ribosylglycohydrolase family protein n=1 Tax=Thalassotalea ponticola TaxID=1523392 RepID=UPI0025B59025|nr:ADP-ribosylglycohydrolase family protein [Thalassotalea ponticola]MDN3651590.1 ADP-ribosylglycohydrolase family protein [Thalassotalea ponticola]